MLSDCFEYSDAVGVAPWVELRWLMRCFTGPGSRIKEAAQEVDDEKATLPPSQFAHSTRSGNPLTVVQDV